MDGYKNNNMLKYPAPELSSMINYDTTIIISPARILDYAHNRDTKPFMFFFPEYWSHGHAGSAARRRYSTIHKLTPSLPTPILSP